MKIIKDYNQKFEHLSKYDSLTNISNRRHFYEILKRYLTLSNRNKNLVTILFVDIDNFKYINDTFGHKVGDDVLKELANILKINTRESDICARWGGEEFVLASINTSLEDTCKIAQKIQVILEDNEKLKLLVGGKITISIGVTLYKNGENIDSFIARADSAMYKAKSTGKNRIVKL